MGEWIIPAAVPEEVRAAATLRSKTGPCGQKLARMVFAKSNTSVRTGNCLCRSLPNISRTRIDIQDGLIKVETRFRNVFVFLFQIQTAASADKTFGLTLRKPTERMNTIENAICNSQKLKITLNDGKVLTIHPYFILEKATNNSQKILRGYIEGEKSISCDVPVDKIKDADVLQEQYAIDQSCLYFNFNEYEIVFPKKEDLNNC